MGFLKEKYSDRRVRLVSAFNVNDEDFFEIDSLAAAIEHFKLVLVGNELYETLNDEETKNKKMAVESQKTLNSSNKITEYAQYFSSWKEESAYYAGEKILYNGDIYEILEDHISSQETRPNHNKKYRKFSVATDWSQPDISGGYKKGDRIYNSEEDESLKEKNLWSPDDYPAGWQLVE